MLVPKDVLRRILCLLMLPAAAASSAAQTTPSHPQSVLTAPRAVTAENGTPNLTWRIPDTNAFAIESPKFGQLINGSTATVSLKIGHQIERKTLRVVLNGKDITSRFSRDRDSAVLTSAQLRTGNNRLVASVRGAHREWKVKRVKFDYYAGLQSGEPIAYYPPTTVGLSLNSGGAQPWVTLTTGTPASLQDNIDRTQYALPYPDATFPSSKDTPCTTQYQIVVLNRQTPEQEDGYMCASSSADLKSKLAGLTKGAEIVLVGTTLYNNADAGLDTTAIGGTNYSTYGAEWQPQGYAAIGVSGANAGSAYESYYLASDVGKAYMQDPFANGLLAVDQHSNFNFHAGNNMQFQVFPNDPTFTNSAFLTAVSTSPRNTLVSAWQPPPGSANGFWLLTLDRGTLLPIDLSNQGSCQGGSPHYCGQFFPTGSTDSTVVSQAVDNLGEALIQSSYRHMLVLTTVGQPFQSGIVGGIDISGLQGALLLLGGTGYALPSLTTSDSTYTLVAAGYGNQNSPIPPRYASPLASGVVNSSSAFSQQGQTGIVRGVMARDNNGLYFPSVSSQEDGKGNGQDATSVSMDYDFYSISTLTPIDWPLTDTSGHIAAYHYASEQFLGYVIGETGTHSADVRYYYGSDNTKNIVAANTDFDCSVNPNEPNCVYVDGKGFTQQDLADANAQLYAEVTALKGTYTFLGDNGGIGTLIEGNGVATPVSDQVIAATYEVLNGQSGASTTTTVAANASDWMNLLAGVTSVAAVAVGGPLELPVAGGVIGVASGALWTGSALGPFGGTDTTTPPSYTNSFDVELGTLEQQQDQYAQGLIISYDTALDNIYSDWFKLSQTGAKTANSDSGWNFPNLLGPVTLGNQLAYGTRRSIYGQVVPQFYQMDSYYAQPITQIDTLGLISRKDGYYGSQPYAIFSCSVAYSSSLPSNGYGLYVASTGKTSDIFVIGGAISNNNTENVSEQLPTSDLLNILFNAVDPNDASTSNNLNIPTALFANPGSMVQRSGPRKEPYLGVGGLCYKPGCSANTWNDPNAETECVGP